MRNNPNAHSLVFLRFVLIGIISLLALGSCGGGVVEAPF